MPEISRKKVDLVVHKEVLGLGRTCRDEVGRHHRLPHLQLPAYRHHVSGLITCCRRDTDGARPALAQHVPGGRHHRFPQLQLHAEPQPLVRRAGFLGLWSEN